MFLVLNFVCYHIFSCFLYGNTYLISHYYLLSSKISGHLLFFFSFFFLFGQEIAFIGERD